MQKEVNFFRGMLEKSRFGVSAYLVSIFSVASIVGIGWYIFSRSDSNEIILIKSPKAPIKVKPTASGIVVPHQDKEIYKSLTTTDDEDQEPDGHIVDQIETALPALITENADVATEDNLKKNIAPADQKPVSEKDSKSDQLDLIADLATQSEAGELEKDQQNIDTNKAPFKKDVSSCFILQIATLYSKDAAYAEAKRLTKKLKDHGCFRPIVISEIQSQDSGTVYRLTIGKFKDKKTALEFAGLIKEYNIKAFVLTTKD